MSTALTSGLESLRLRTLAALAGLPVQWGLGGGRPIPPILLIQPSSPGQVVRHIGQEPGWRGEITVRAQTATPEEAQALFEQAATILADDVNDGTYLMRWRSIRPVLGHTGPQVTTRGALYQVDVTPL